MISSSERAQALELVSEACANGARKGKACELLTISARTLVRWQKPNGTQDQRLTKHKAQNKNISSDGNLFITTY